MKRITKKEDVVFQSEPVITSEDADNKKADEKKKI